MSRTYAIRPPDQPWYTNRHTSRDWMLNAACRDGHDPELWFPDYQRDRIARYPANQATRLAQHICQECPVQAACLHHALVTDTRYGIWGGTTPNDRARLTGEKAHRMSSTRKPVEHGKTYTYAKYDCRCDECRRAWRNDARRRNNARPSLLALEVERLNNELDAAELNLNALRDENAMLRCRLAEVDPP